MDDIKVCRNCRKKLPITEYDLVWSKSKYYRSECKKCRKKQNQEDYLKRKEKIKKEKDEEKKLDKMNKIVYKEFFGEDL